MTLRILLVFIASFLFWTGSVLFSGCKKSETPPENVIAPVMSSIAITGQESTYEVTIGFSQGVFRFANSSGDLNIQSFRVSIEGGSLNILNFVVTHTAGQKSALIRIQFDRIPDGTEFVNISPFDGNSIYNASGRPMLASELKSISTAGIEHETIYVKDEGAGTGTVKWTSNNTYVLDGFVFVNEGQVLTIEAGTIVKGKAGNGENASALIIARGGKIRAEGTVDRPIVFTAESDDLNGSVNDLDDGLWGGLILLGKATLNAIPGEQHVEGIPEEEMRGFRNTVIEYVEVFSHKDDGVEIFGGAPSLKYIISAFCGDDAFDSEQGYHGRGQFWLGVQGFNHGDRLAEHDGGTDPLNGLPLAIPTICNATYVGQPAGAGRRAVSFGSNSGGHYVNSIFYQQAYGIDIQLSTSDCSFDRWNDGDLSISNNLFYLIDQGQMIYVMATAGVSEDMEEEANGQLDAYFMVAGNTVTDPGFELNGLTFKVIPTNDVSDNLGEYPDDGWFEEVGFKGALAEDYNWVADWSLFSKYMN
ncbi:MAG: hypothetical protein P8100_11725 [bacterium]